MHRPDCEFPSAEVGLQLHLRLVDDDPTATADACRAYLDSLRAWLQARFPKVDETLRHDALSEALINYVQRPTSYDPRKAELGAFLRMAARRDLLNLLRKEKRHQRQRVPWSLVEQGDEHGNLSGREEEPSVYLQREETASAWQALLRSVAERCTDQEKRVLDLMLEGERRTAVYAAALGIDDRPLEEQEREVKKLKDRLTKRLERGGRSHA